jgi:hypothetical protein
MDVIEVTTYEYYVFSSREATFFVRSTKARAGDFYPLGFRSTSRPTPLSSARHSWTPSRDHSSKADRGRRAVKKGLVFAYRVTRPWTAGRRGSTLER